MHRVGFWREQASNTPPELTLARRVVVRASSGRAPSTTYYFRVAAANAVATGYASVLVAAATTVATVPAAPLVPTASHASSTTLTLTWSAPADTGGLSITEYDLEYRALGNRTLPPRGLVKALA